MNIRSGGVAALLCAALVAGCAGGPRVESHSSEADETSTSTCAPSVAAGTSDQTIESAGGRRTFLVSVPTDSAATHPVVLSLHGLGASATKQESYSRLGAEGAARGYVVVTPQALGTPSMWTIPPVPGTDDVRLMTDLIAWTAMNACGDVARVYVAGISNGASMAGALSCELATQVRAAAMVAGPNAYPPCADQPPVALMGFHGTDDPLVPYDGGQLFGNSERLRAAVPQASKLNIKPTEGQLAGWAQRNGCTVGPATAPARGSVVEVTYSQCDDGADTVLYRIDGGGHTWPGATAVGEKTLGPTTHDIDATAVILDFFDAHA